MEADETERTEAVVNADGGIGDVFVLGGERMEMRNANRLRQKQYSCGDTGYPAHPASTICRCWLHQVIANCCGPHPAQNNLSAFAASVKFSLPSDIQAVRKMRDTAYSGYFQPKKSCAQMKWPTPAARAAAASIS